MEAKRITKLAEDLSRHYSYGLLCKQLGLNYRTLKRRITHHSWLIDEANIINRYHAMLIKEIEA